jgi:hypothetical protein
MRKYDYSDSPPPKSRSGVFWTIMTVITLLGVVCIAGAFLIVFTNPSSSINPFPPPTMPAVLQFPSATPTDVVFSLPPTWTPTFTLQPTATSTPTPTNTLPATPTPITLTSTPTASPPPPVGGYPFEVRQGNPKAIPNIYHPELSCSWMGVGGQVIDMSNAPVIGLIIRLGGGLPGVHIPEDTFSLTGLALNYGRSGYEFTLANQPLDSKGQLWVQLLSQEGGPLSEQVYFDTYADCEKNLIIIDFVQVRK